MNITAEPFAAAIDYESLPVDPGNPTGPRTVILKLDALDAEGELSDQIIALSVTDVVDSPYTGNVTSVGLTLSPNPDPGMPGMIKGDLNLAGIVTAPAANSGVASGSIRFDVKIWDSAGNFSGGFYGMGDDMHVNPGDGTVAVTTDFGVDNASLTSGTWTFVVTMVVVTINGSRDLDTDTTTIAIPQPRKVTRPDWSSHGATRGCVCECV